MGGFFSRLFGGAKSPGVETTVGPKIASDHPQAVRLGVAWDDIEVAGESHYRDGIKAIFKNLGRLEGGITMQTAHLIPEPTNKYDRNAVKVVIQGHQVGHVPREMSREVAQACRAAGRRVTGTVPARIWGLNDNGVWRARVTLVFSGDSEDEQDFAAIRREKEASDRQRQAARNAKAVERAEREAARAEKERIKSLRLKAGEVAGSHWATFKPAIAELKRQQLNEEARELLIACVEAAEREAAVNGALPNSWPTEQLSVVLRKLQSYEAELSYLERYCEACGDRSVPETVKAKVARARLKAAAAQD